MRPDRLPRLFALVAFFASLAITVQGQDEARVLSIGGSVTEIIYALGEEHRLVARDTTSTYPEAANDLTDVGYMRALSPEGVLSVDPELIVSEEGAGPPEVIEVLKSASIPFVEIPEVYDAAGIVAKIRAVGTAIGVPEKAEELAARVEADLAEAEAAAASHEGEPKRVLFILSTANGRIMASGTGTAADGIIRMAGAVNAIDSFEGYKPLTDEAINLAAPDAILMLDRTGDHGLGAAELFAMPALATTPAAETGALFKMNGLLLLGFGPRTAEAVRGLTGALYGG